MEDKLQVENKPITKLIDALTARTRFGELLDEVDKEQVRVVVSRRGKAKVVILSVRDYLRNIVKQPELLTKIQFSAKEAGLDTISDAEIDAEIAAYRAKNE
jgi:prevent-host-death family protein